MRSGDQTYNRLATKQIRLQRNLRLDSVGSCRLHHVAIRANTGTAALLVLPEDRFGVCFGSRLQGLLRSCIVLGLSQPSDDTGFLQGFAVGERQMPRQLSGKEAIHGAQVYGGLFLIIFIQRCLARQEENARHRGRNCAQQGLASQRCNGLCTGFGSSQAVLHHVGLQDSTLHKYVVIGQGLELRLQYLSCCLRIKGLGFRVYKESRVLTVNPSMHRMSIWEFPNIFPKTTF